MIKSWGVPFKATVANPVASVVGFGLDPIGVGAEAPIAIRTDLIGTKINPDPFAQNNVAWVWNCPISLPRRLLRMPSWPQIVHLGIAFGSPAYPYPPWALIYNSECDYQQNIEPALITDDPRVSYAQPTFSNESNEGAVVTEESNPNILPLANSDLGPISDTGITPILPPDFENMPLYRSAPTMTETTVELPGVTTINYTPASYQSRLPVINPTDVGMTFNTALPVVSSAQSDGGLAWLVILAIAIGVMRK